MKNTILSTCLLLSSMSFAATVETNQTLVPKAGQSEALAGYIFQNPKATISNSDATTKQNGYSLPVSYFYGLSDYGAIGAEFNFGNNQSDTESSGGTSTFKSTGIGDIAIRYKGNLEVGGPTLFYSVGYLTGLEKNKSEDKSNTESEETRASAQPQIQLQVAAVQPTTFAKLGALLQWNIAQKGQNEDTSVSGAKTTYDITGGGGTRLLFFGEMENYYHPNLALTYERSYSTQKEFNNTKSATMGAEFIGVELSARMEAAPGIELIPNLAYQTLNNKKDSATFSFDQFDRYALGLTGRFLF